MWYYNLLRSCRILVSTVVREPRPSLRKNAVVHKLGFWVKGFRFRVYGVCHSCQPEPMIRYYDLHLASRLRQGWANYHELKRANPNCSLGFRVRFDWEYTHKGLNSGLICPDRGAIGSLIVHQTRNPSPKSRTFTRNPIPQTLSHI